MTPKNTITLKAQFGLVLNWAFIAQSGRRLLVIIVMNILLKKLWNILSGRQTEVKERLLIQWFFLQDYACLRAYSGTEAVMLLEREQPDLIILDLMLPGLSGEDVLKKIVGIPVIVVSAKAGVDDKVALLLGGAQDYLTKPFSTKELLARVEVQLRKTAASLDNHASPSAMGSFSYNDSNDRQELARMRNGNRDCPQLILILFQK